MIIPITLSTGDAPGGTSQLPSGLAKLSNDEIVLIELQGALDTGDAHPTERNGKFVGKLSIDDAMKKPTLLIGHHLLEGKIAAIPKPLAIMHRINSTGKKKNSLSMDVDESQFEDAIEGHEEHGEGPSNVPKWTLLGLVKKKIIFSKRPMPVIKRS